MTIEALDALLTGGAPAAKFPDIGDKVVGTILEIEHTQQTDLDGAPKVWDDGKPMMQFVITLQTDDRDPEIPDDDGKRRLFAKGKMLTAVKAAITQSKASKDAIVGGRLAVAYTGDGEATKRGYSAPKLYTAQFKPAAPSAADDLLDDAPAKPTADDLL